MRIVVQQLHDHLTPSHRAHGDSKGLQDVALLCLDADLGETKEGFHLKHQAPELCAPIDGNLKGWDFDVAAQVLNVVVQAAEVVGGQREEVLSVPEFLVVVVEFVELVIKSHPVDVRPDETLHDVVQAIGKRHAARTDSGQHLRWVGLFQLLRQLLFLLVHGSLQVAKLGQDRADCLDKHPLDPLLHELRKVAKADHGQELLRRAE
mmetsp:Transcript_48694/g.112855  ORF Transcript_48694/g.112855 Transcript_48694/m.112855 type:complete len:206 (-) Transcript_48694:863-1480(-)